jgi:hypothetical protein
MNDHGTGFVLHPRPAPRRRTLFSLATVLAVAAVLAGAGAVWLTRPTGPDVALALSFEEGRTYRDRLDLGMDGTLEVLGREVPFTMEASEVVTTRVIEVAPSGETTLEIAVEDLSASFSGIPVPEIPGKVPPIRLTVSPDGRVTTEDGLTFPGPPADPGNLPANQMFPLLPDHPVGPGDTWEVEYRQRIPFVRGAIEIDARNAFLRYHDVGGTRVAVIDSHVSMPIDFQVDLGDAAAFADQFGLPGDRPLSDQFGTPADEPVPDLTLAYRGHADTRQVAWIVPATGQIVKSSSVTDMELTTEITEPAAQTAADLEFTLAGEMTVDTERL